MVEEAKTEKIEEDEKIKEQYHNLYKYSKVQQMVLEKKGLSDFEIYAGVSEIIFGRNQIQRALIPSITERPLPVKVKDPNLFHSEYKTD
mmetsp:Transcript_8899/g.15098  ORF Transcript_8899/g.15098 Transcript_8899/m.15098 type:complete len:89 (+) Transcript_8899:977-1243(+)